MSMYVKMELQEGTIDDEPKAILTLKAFGDHHLVLPFSLLLANFLEENGFSADRMVINEGDADEREITH